MDNNTRQSSTDALTAAAAAHSAIAAYPQQTPYHHLLHQQEQQLQIFWNHQRQEMEEATDFKNHQLPLAPIEKIMKVDEDVHMISAEAPVLFAKACELFIQELTIRSWHHAKENKRSTLQKNDIAAAITRTDFYDFLVDIAHRLVGPIASGVPYYYPPLGQPAPDGVMLDRPAVPGVDLSMNVNPPPLQALQSVWQTSEDHSSAGGSSSSGPGNLDCQMLVGPIASGVPYYYPPLGQPAPDGVMLDRPAVPGVDLSMNVNPPPLQALQSVWQTSEDHSSAGGSSSSGPGNLDCQM